MTARTNWFDGQRVFADALTHSQNSLIAADKVRFTDFFSQGVVNGLSVAADNVHSVVQVASGVAYDGLGDRVALSTWQSTITYNGLSVNASAGTYDVVVQHVDVSDGVYGITMDGLSVPIHYLDGSATVLKKQGVDSISPLTDVVLGSLVVATPGGAMSLSTLSRQVVSLKTFGP